MSVKQSVITVTAQQGDSLDSVIYRYFGRSSGLLEATLAINPHLPQWQSCRWARRFI